MRTDEAFLADVALIRESGLFNAAWYMQRYPDVAMSGLDPAEHFLRYGALLGRNPGPDFDVARYLRSHPEIKDLGVNPLVYHMRLRRKKEKATTAQAKVGGLAGYLESIDELGVAGWAVDNNRPGQPVELSLFIDGEHILDLVTSNERPDLARHGMDGRCAGFSIALPASLLPKGAEIDIRFKSDGHSLKKSPRTLLYGPSAPEHLHSSVLHEFKSGRMRFVTVIVPVFNAHDAVADCLAALSGNLPAFADLLLIDDASTDPRMTPLLEQYASAHERVRVVRNPENLGYTKTINKGIEIAKANDVVLLNSDTRVTDRWLDSLRYCAYAKPKVATVTALSNNAGAFSVPEMGRENPCPTHLDDAGFGRVVTAATSGRSMEVPTGNGFCMYIRREALQALGGFDEVRYPRGYGEENDFCMRAVRRGWKNLVSDKAFVLHKRSQSFQGEKADLIRMGRQQLDFDYPEYGLLIKRFSDLEFSYMRKKVSMALNTSNNVRPRALYVISTQTGGTPQTNLDLMRAMSDDYDCWLLRCDSRVITLSQLADGELQVRETHYLAEHVGPVTHTSEEYDSIVADILYRQRISILHIRHVAWHSLNISAIAKSQNIPVIYSLHDFYSVCPSLNLLDNNLKFCGGVCTSGDGHCTASLWPDAEVPNLKHRFVNRWREMIGEFLASCDEFVTTVPTAAATIENVFPQLSGRVTVIPHGRDFAHLGSYARFDQKAAKIKVLIPGNIGASKGSELFRRLAEIGAEDRYEFHFLGGTAGILHGIGKHHGRYNRSNFQSEVKKISPAFGVIFSIWAETYCHTLTEMWSCGIPVLGMDIGAVGDRIRKSGAGWLIDPTSTPEEVLASLDCIVQNTEDYKRKVDAVVAWQKSEAIWNDTETMAAKYRALYDRASSRRTSKRMSIGLLHKQKPYVPATAFIRVTRPWRRFGRTENHDVRSITAPWLIAGGVNDLDALVIQRDALPSHEVGEVLACLTSHRVPYLYEIDDPLWALDPNHPDHVDYAESAAGIVELIREASVVTTSTQGLAESIGKINPRVAVVEAWLDRVLWTTPLPDSMVTGVLMEAGLLGVDRPRVLYMGTHSHSRDLQLIMPAIQALTDARPEVEFIQIGGGDPLPGARYIAVPEEFATYPRFVQWFRAICSSATIAIAPLEDNGFNQVKSDIKVLDYAYGRLPGVFSSVGPYKSSVAHGRTGMLAENNAVEWIASMSKLLDDDALRGSIRRSALVWAERTNAERETRFREVAESFMDRVAHRCSAAYGNVTGAISDISMEHAR